ncbi:MAG TPA: restriction endonuclease subunit S [Spirochaetota bacterium]|nr:restriction endonuclease subunit S [Spirochaetota bacterium]
MVRMNKVIQLQEISQINSGYQFRGDLPELQPGEWKFIQMRDIDSDNSINQDTVINIDFKIKEGPADKYLLNKGDILFKNRGAKNNAAVFNLDWPQVIVSHQFLIVRTTDNAMIAEYLAWYINSESAQLYFKQHAAGTTTLLIQKKTLEELEIVVPSIEIQKSIVEVEHLRNREKHLVSRKMVLRDKYIDKVLSECINSQRKK